MQRLMRSLRLHAPRILITLLPVLLGLAHAAGWWKSTLLDRMDMMIYDARMRATAPGTLDPRIVIVGIDDASLDEMGQWPWSRRRLARLTTELIERQQAAAVGFDVIFAESDRGSVQSMLQELREHGNVTAAQAAREADHLNAGPDPDQTFAQVLARHDVVLGFAFSHTPQPVSRGLLPPPLLPPEAFPAAAPPISAWNSYDANIPGLASVASAGFLNVRVAPNSDGVVRSVALLARYAPGADMPGAGYYESLALALYRRVMKASPPYPRFADMPANLPPMLQSLVMGRSQGALSVPVDAHAYMLVPYRGAGGPRGGSFQYLSAADLLQGRVAAGSLAGKIVLVGASAPGLQDLHITPMSVNYPGVEVHANVLSALLDQRFRVMPPEAAGYNVAMIVVLGLVLAVGLSLLRPGAAVLLVLAVLAFNLGVNQALFMRAHMVLPQAASLLVIALALLLNTGWGYFGETRTRRSIAKLFGTYVHPALVREMVRDPERYSMRAQNRVLTVMFCDMRGFTRLSERMAPEQLQAFLNHVFSRLAEIINNHDGTVDKYMGDCVMAFWGAPVETNDHANQAVRAALSMVQAVRRINSEPPPPGMAALPAFSVGLGLSTGLMSVGDMGSTQRRSYTVIGDPVNLAARLEGLGERYGVEVLANDATSQAADAFLWQRLDRVHVKGKDQPVAIYTPHLPTGADDTRLREELAQWHRFLDCFEQRQWAQARQLLQPLLAQSEKKTLYRHYAERLASLPP